MLNRTRALSISAISGTILISASAQTADPPLFTFFKTFCADTKADAAAIKKAVEAAGGEVTIKPGHDNFTDTMTWEKIIDGTKITLSASGLYFRAANAPFERYDTRCFIYGFSYDAAGADAIRDWIGVPPSKTWPGVVSQMDTYTYQEAGGMKSAIPLQRYFDTDDTWMIDVDWGSGGISVDMWHNRRYLRGTIPGQPAPTSN